SSRLWARVSHGRSLRWHSNRGGPIASGACPAARDSPPFVAMFDELRRLGFIEGQNLTIDWQVYALHIDLIPVTPDPYFFSRREQLVEWPRGSQSSLFWPQGNPPGDRLGERHDRSLSYNCFG